MICRVWRGWTRREDADAYQAVIHHQVIPDIEALCLEGFQSGLSWRTILAKRENFRAAFHGFDIERVARFGARDVTRLLGDEGIVRHRGKIEAVINNAQRARELIARDGSLAGFIWSFEPKQHGAPQIVATSAESIALWFKSIGHENWFSFYLTTVIAVSLPLYASMRDTRHQSAMGRHA